MNQRKRCPAIEIGHAAHFWRIDGARVRIQPAPGVLYCPGPVSTGEAFVDPSIAEQLTLPVNE